MHKNSIGPAISSGILKNVYNENTNPEIINIQNNITKKVFRVIFINL